jgi:8-oxo-dGTP diphosphatase
MAAKDGDGWALCDRGHQHWGIHGATGLLAVHHAVDGTPYVLMQKRSWWSHHGGTWGLPGGAMDSHEDAIAGALREAWEEAALTQDLLQVRGVFVDDHGGWSFQTVIAEAGTRFDAVPANGESSAMLWVAVEEVAARKLHPGFAETWPLIREALQPLIIVIDAANVIGARAEHGWWRDRAGATARLLGDVGNLLGYGVRLPAPSPLDKIYPQVIVVVEGAARSVAEEAAPPGITIVAAGGSGDDAIVETVRLAREHEQVLVITADRGLRERVLALGAEVTGPRWLLDQLS